MRTPAEVLKEDYGITDAVITPLNSFDNINYLVETGKDRYILKEYEGRRGQMSLVHAENKVLDSLRSHFPDSFPDVLLNLSEEKLAMDPAGKSNSFFRLQRYIEGKLMPEATHTRELYRSLGGFLARMDTTLLELHSSTIQARDFPWNQDQPEVTLAAKRHIPDPRKRKLVDYFEMQYRELVKPRLPLLRKSIIHGDANELNIIVENNAVKALIDFGDMHYASLVNELAIALAYALMDKEDPLAWAEPVIAGYCNILPLEEHEVALLYYLIAMRLCISACGSALAKVREPENTYLAISEEQVWKLLEKWITISPIRAGDAFMRAAGHDSCGFEDLEDDIAQRNQYLSKAYSLSYTSPIKMRKAAFQYMYDFEGNTYLDARNNIPHVGHAHPKVVEAGIRTMVRLNTNTRYLYDMLNDYAERLLDRFPPPLNKVFFVNSGSAAADLAMRMAEAATGKKHWVVMEQGYHGNTKATIDISHYKFGNKGGGGRPDRVHVAAMPDLFRGEGHRSAGAQEQGSAFAKATADKGPNLGRYYADQLVEELKDWKGEIAAFIAEPDIGCGGQVPLPPGYLDVVYPFIRGQGGVCIMDEVQTGFGRLGTHFWGFEKLGVVPDIVLLGKPMANGHPMGAVVCTLEVCDAFETGMEFFSSFGGNPVSCAMGLAVLEVLEEEQLQRNALETGTYFMEELRKLSLKHPSMGDVRGSGFYFGIDFVKDPVTKAHHTELAAYVCNELRNNFILTGTDGPFENVLKIKPPMCFGRENVDEFLDKLDKILDRSR